LQRRPAAYTIRLLVWRGSGAFRARFQEAFDIALDKAPLHTTTEGEEE
jgi:hypothetical protein